METIEEEQYALVYYLQHGNPSPVWRKAAEERIRKLELLKNPIVKGKIADKSSSDNNFFSRNNITYS